MASLESRFFHMLLRLINKKKFLNLQFSFGRFDFYKCLYPPREIFGICNVESYQINGRNVFTLKPRKNIGGKHILYLHGGAYVQNFVREHWHFMAWLVKHLNCTITTPDYPLAPGFTYEDSFAMVVPLYKELITKIPSRNFILMGDSAGGGFALALAQKMKNEDIDQPDQIILLSPWLDIALTNPDIKDIDPFDPFLGIDSLQKAGMAYAGNASLGNFLLSPINGPLEGLGKISLFIGSKDILVADARKLNAIAKSKNIHINYFEYPDMLHVWMFMNFPEARKAKEQIVELIRNDR